MNKTTAIPIMITLLLLATLSSPTLGDQTQPSANPWISSGELPEGFDHVTGPAATVTCTSLAPGDIPPCNGPIGDIRLDNPHVSSAGIIAIGFPFNQAGPIPFTGTLQMVLTHGGGTVEFQCSWVNNVLTGCQVLSAQWPPVGAQFDIECASLPLSVGDWACSLTHTP